MTKPIIVRINEDDLIMLNELALANGWTVSKVVRTIVSDFCDFQKFVNEHLESEGDK